MTSPDPARIGQVFKEALARFGTHAPTLVVSHNDADGLASAAILARALAAAGRDMRTRILGRGETPWAGDVRRDLEAAEPGGLIVSDLGTRAGPIAPGVPTVIIDHHVPTGTPEGATLITGYGLEPTPNTSLLAYWAAGAVADVADVLWLAALGMIGYVTDDAGFPEMAEARRGSWDEATSAAPPSTAPPTKARRLGTAQDSLNSWSCWST